MFQQHPFASKELPNGKKLFRRVHGIQLNLIANDNVTYEFNVPYNNCKINKLEVVWCPEHVKCDVSVLDTPTGTISGIANYELNKFGHDVNISKNFYNDFSEYDADLIKDMKLKFVLKNGSSSTSLIGINIVLHEVV